ncbi:MAG: YceI family protein [Chloroflexota bacterium]
MQTSHRSQPLRVVSRGRGFTALGLLVAAFAVAGMPAATLAQSPAASTQPAASAAAASSLDGTWTIDPTIGSFDYAANDFSGTWVGYRVQEELAGVGGTTAVGRSPDLTGSITLSGTTLTAASLTADLTTLQSDESMRDGQLAQQGVQSNQFPTATFVLTTPIELGSIPEENVAFTVDATGDLTIHGVTKSVTIPLNVIRSGDIVGVSGSLTFTWGDFGMEQPTSMRVVSLADDVTMELQAFFRHDTGATASEAPAASPAA